MAEPIAHPGWKKHVCGQDCEDCDCDPPETMYFPPEDEWVTVINATVAREVGDDPEHDIPAGAPGVVMGVWEECHDVDVEVPGVGRVWIDPENLRPRHMVQIKPMILTGKEAIDANPDEATDFSVYLGAPGRFEWQQDFPTVEEARWYAGELAKTHDVPESDIEDLSAHVVEDYEEEDSDEDVVVKFDVRQVHITVPPHTVVITQDPDGVAHVHVDGHDFGTISMEKEN